MIDIDCNFNIMLKPCAKRQALKSSALSRFAVFVDLSKKELHSTLFFGYSLATAIWFKYIIAEQYLVLAQIGGSLCQ